MKELTPLKSTPNPNSIERIGYAYKIQRMLDLLSLKIEPIEKHIKQNNQKDNLYWGGEMFSNHLSLHIKPDVCLTCDKEAYGYWIEARFFLEGCTQNNHARATIWIKHGGAYFENSSKVLDGEDMHLSAKSFNELVELTADLINKTVKQHRLSILAA